MTQAKKSYRPVRENFARSGMNKTSEVAKKLKGLRERAGMSVRELAGVIDVPASTYAAYEDKFKKRYLPIDLVKRLLPVLQARSIPPAEVLELAGIDDEILAVIDEALGPTTDEEMAGALALVEMLKGRLKGRFTSTRQAEAIRDSLRLYRKYASRRP
jgi:transcriptional regulator with XRE-family HTH domain